MGDYPGLKSPYHLGTSKCDEIFLLALYRAVFLCRPVVSDVWLRYITHY